MTKMCAIFTGLLEMSASSKKNEEKSSVWDLKGGRKSALSWTDFLAKQQILLLSLGNYNTNRIDYCLKIIQWNSLKSGHFLHIDFYGKYR